MPAESERQPSSTASSSTAPSSAAPSPEPKKILVADDDADIVRLVRFILMREGYQVVSASNGREALTQVVAHKPDLIILDVGMPELDGFEALRALKEDTTTAHIPVIMMTARNQDADVEQGTALGAYYMTKPFELKTLAALIRGIFS